jgi:hypothetical protein
VRHLRRIAPRNSGRAKIITGVLSMASRIEISTAMSNSTVTSRRLTKGRLTRRKGPRVDLDNLSMPSKKSRDRSRRFSGTTPYLLRQSSIESIRSTTIAPAAATRGSIITTPLVVLLPPPPVSY